MSLLIKHRNFLHQKFVLSDRTNFFYLEKLTNNETIL